MAFFETQLKQGRKKPTPARKPREGGVGEGGKGKEGGGGEGGEVVEEEKVAVNDETDMLDSLTGTLHFLNLFLYCKGKRTYL